MIPEEGKKYMIACMGPYDYNRYVGEGICVGNEEPYGNDTAYGFKIPVDNEIVYFLDEDIVAAL